MSTTPNPSQEELDLVERGKKCLALSDWQGAVEHYAKVLELARTRTESDTHPSMAPLLLSYGKALVEVAIANQGVLGKDDEDGDEEQEQEQGASSTDPTPKDDDDQEDQEEVDDDDDFTIAWEILDLARTLYQRRAGEAGEDVGRELGECFGLLGDVSLEGENFPQAAQDYKSALEAYTSSLAPSSREIASSHLKLAIALENVPSGRSEAVLNVEKAIESVKARKKGLEQGLEVDKAPRGEHEGKGKGKGEVQMGKEEKGLSDEERGRRVKDCQELLVDLEAKLEDLRTSPQQRDVVEESVAHLLGNAPGDIATATTSALSSGSNIASTAASSASAVANSTTAKVNDLTGMVRRKGKKAVDQASVEAGKAGEVVAQTTGQVKDKAGEVAQSAVDAAAVQADKAKNVVLEKGAQAFEAANEQAGVVGEKASEVAQQALDAASEVTQQTTEVVSAQTSQAMDVAADQAAGLAQSISETASSLATSAQEAIVDAAEQAQNAIAGSEILRRADAQIDAIKDKTVRLVSPATFDAMLQSVSRTTRGIVNEIVNEGKEMTRQNVDAVGSVVGDLDHARTRATELAGEVTETAVELGKEAYDKAMEQGRAVVDEIMEEGKGMTHEGVESVAGVVEDVLGGIEKAGREGKRKVEEVVPEPVVEQEDDESRRAKKQKTA